MSPGTHCRSGRARVPSLTAWRWPCVRDPEPDSRLRAPPRTASARSLRRTTRALQRPKRAGGGGVHALVAVVPADAVARMRIVSDDLLDHSGASRALGRLRLDGNTCAGLKSHLTHLLLASPRA